MRQYLIVHLFKPLDEGTLISSGNWPLHITLLENFSIDDSKLDSLISGLGSIASSNRSIATVAEQEALFGPNNDIPVVRATKTKGLNNLHLQLVGMVDDLKPVYTFPNYIKDGYSPHSTIQKDSRIYPGDKLQINSLTLIDYGIDEELSSKIIRSFNFRPSP